MPNEIIADAHLCMCPPLFIYLFPRSVLFVRDCSYCMQVKWAYLDLLNERRFKCAMMDVADGPFSMYQRRVRSGAERLAPLTTFLRFITGFSKLKSELVLRLN